MELNNIKPLDGVRTIAIFLVIIWHYLYCQINGDYYIFGINIAKNLKFLTFWTWSGVDLFFVLSGFLIGRILIFNKKSKNYFKAFYYKRFLRIFPAYYLILLAFVIILFTGLNNYLPWLTQNPHPIYSYLFYLQNFWTAHSGIFGANWLSVTWSLAVEEQFYLILPLLIFIIDLKYLPTFLVLGIISAPIFRLTNSELGPYVLLYARMDSLLLGVLIAFYYLNGTIYRFFKNKLTLLISFMICMFLLLYYFGTGNKAESIGGVYIHTILAFLYGALIILVLVADENYFIIKIFSTSFMLFFAKISYMIYLSHQIFSGILFQLILNHEPQIINRMDLFVNILAFVTTVIFSAISYRFFEKPILSIGKRIKY